MRGERGERAARVFWRCLVCELKTAKEGGVGVVVAKVRRRRGGRRGRMRGGMVVVVVGSAEGEVERRRCNRERGWG